MSAKSNYNIDSLCQALEEAKNSKKNKQKYSKKTRPEMYFSLEEPIASAKLFNFDVAERYYADPQFFVETTLRQKLWRHENFNDDMPISLDFHASLGYYVEYTYLGMSMYFDSAGVPIIQEDHPISKSKDLSLLKPVDFKNSGWMPRLMKWHDDISSIANGRMNIFFPTWWRGPLDLAVQLRGYENLVMDSIEDPEFVHDLLKFITQERIRWYQAYTEYFDVPMPTGGIGDDWINIPFITPEFFEEFLTERYMEIAESQGGVDSVHSCGNQTPIQKQLLKIKNLKFMEISPWTDLECAVKENVPKDMSFLVNAHPNDVLFADDDEMRKKFRFIKDLCKNRNYFLNTSGLTPISPVDNEKDFIQKINRWIDIGKEVYAEPY